MVIREARWHQTVKEVLKEIGERKGYDVSQSEQEMHLTQRFSAYADEKRQLHTLSYKPDVVWKKGGKYRALFEIEYINPGYNSQIMDKRKYAVGSLSLGLLGTEEKSCDYLIFVTNSKSLCDEIAKFVTLSKKLTKSWERVFYYVPDSTKPAGLGKELYSYLIKELKL